MQMLTVQGTWHDRTLQANKNIIVSLYTQRYLTADARKIDLNEREKNPIDEILCSFVKKNFASFF
jgi:hypothetical protein